MSQTEKTEVVLNEDYQRLLNDSSLLTIKLEIVEEIMTNDSQTQMETALPMMENKGDCCTNKAEEATNNPVNEQPLKKASLSNSEGNPSDQVEDMPEETVQRVPYIIPHVRESLATENRFPKEINLNTEEEANDESRQYQESTIEMKKFPKKGSNFVKKFKDMMTKVSRKLVKDPWMKLPQGKFRESVVSKANQMHELFPHSDMANILEFVSKSPKELTINHLVDGYLDKQ
jgi:hypothetical protein